MSKIDNPKSWIARYKEIIRTIIREELTSDNGKVKRHMAITALNLVINIPFIPKVLEARFIGWLIDLFVWILNQVWSKKWIRSQEEIEQKLIN